ncbi:hypothetical protein Tco_1122779 [Tanacetum coccineum]|uniref:Retrotransposon gag domain-containing protein n=1 Tax=Tanacetum coccineum TaxID=301880 RepID=A0ABQ5J1N8_9ASTR
MESSNSNSKERELQLTQRLAKQRHSNCMTWFEQLETHLHDLYLLNSPYAVDAFKPAFRSFFGEEHQTFKLKMFHNLDQLRLQLERENLHGVNAKTCLQALRTQFKEFLASKGQTRDLKLLLPKARGKGQYMREAVDAGLVVTESSGTKPDKQNYNHLRDDTSEKVIHESSSTSDSERTESETEAATPKGDKDQGEVDSSTITLGVSIPVSDPEKTAHEALARIMSGPDPEPMQEDQTGSNSGKLHVSLTRPNPEHMDDELTEAEEEAVAREVHATHARIVSEPDPEPMQEDQTGSNSGKLHVSLAGPNPEYMDDELTEAEEEAVAREVHATHARIVSGPDPKPMQEDQTGSNSGKLHVSLAGPNPEHIDDEFLAIAYPKVHENLKLITDERVIEDNPESHSGSMSSMKNLDDTYNFGDQFLYDKPTEDDQEKSKVIKESDSTIPDPSYQTVTSTPPVIAPFTNVSSTKPSSLVTPPPINTEATTITTSLPEITPFIALQLRVARLEQEMSEVKKTDHSADVLASIKSQVPTVVDEYLGTKLDDSLIKILERHTTDLIKKYSVLPGPHPSLLRTVTYWKGKPSLRSTEVAEESYLPHFS